MNKEIVSFNTGEMTPETDALENIEKYASGCRHLENMIPRIYGPAERRPGTRFVSNRGVFVSKLGWVYTYIAENGYVEILDENYDIDREIQLPTSGAMSLDIDEDGNIAVTQIITGNYTAGVLKYDSSDVLQTDFYVPDGGWVVHSALAVGVRFTHDSAYLYVFMTRGPSYFPYLYKFNNTTGAEEWNVVLAGISPVAFSMEIDSSDNIYIYDNYGSPETIKKYSNVDGSLLQTYTVSGGGESLGYVYDIHIDEDLDRIYVCGPCRTSGGVWTQIASTKWSDGTDLQTFQSQNLSTIHGKASVTKGNYVYLVGSRATNVNGTGTIWKLNVADLTYVAHYDTEHGANHVWLDWLDRIVMLGGSTEDRLYVFNDNLGLISSHECTSSRIVYGSHEGITVPAGVAAAAL